MSLEALINEAKGKGPIEGAKILSNPNNDVLRGFYSAYSTLSSEAAKSLGGDTTRLSRENIVDKFAQYLTLFEKVTQGKHVDVPEWRKVIEHGKAENLIRQIAEQSKMSYDDYMNMIQREGMWHLVNTHMGSMKTTELQQYFAGAMSYLKIPEDHGERVKVATQLMPLLPNVGGKKPETIANNLEQHLGSYIVQYANSVPIDVAK